MDTSTLARLFKPSLRGRIYFLLLGLVAINIIGASVTFWYSYRTRDLYTTLVDSEIQALTAAQGLESALVMQKGFATYYFLNDDPAWLERLEFHHQRFEEWIKKARRSPMEMEALEILSNIESHYLRYVVNRDRVLDLYKKGQRDAGANLHWEVRKEFLSLYNLCKAYKTLHEELLTRESEKYKEKADLVAVMAGVALPGSVLFGVLLVLILLKQVLGPIRQLAMETQEKSKVNGVGDEVEALRQRVHHLITDVDKAKSKLEESREHLLQSEKLAMVGKLAAGVAHSIRNPLTSVKMRLFSLERTLRLDSVQKEDFEVISEEIRHIDTIVKNFLEFARPPKLKVQPVSPSEVVDTALQLLRHRLESHGVEIKVVRNRRLPILAVDGDQLKEVLVNLLLNACDAMAGGGKINIREEEGIIEPRGRVALIRISDTGPGISEDLQAEIFQPFFSTKEEGTGLGLSIARRIVVEHGGWLHVHSTEGQGATFVIGLPCTEEDSWLQS
ncbi:sensor histidine kinase [Desulfovibrio ferrophilus]|uniref:histidine kinase n=1 Tax=Desulfovibrio ferrophilus TaxID=241368 RepID=A0A2Z6B0U8_9BACT|nr:ATP-binding protein [Desulfovibrio ferrophilus]BBD09068.1 integral membrane sensor signal transduction histidine kinase [Desulfovibrio ferrophilus]